MVTYITVVQVFQSAVQFTKQMSELSEISSEDVTQPLLKICY